MLPEKVDEMLGKYRLCVGKSKHLELEIAVLSSRLQRVRETVQFPGTVLDGMPREHKATDPTGRAAVDFADGDRPQYIREIEADLQSLIEEKADADSTVLFVDTWLHVLDAHERAVIECRIIDGKSWRVVCEELQNIFGVSYSMMGVRNIMTRALKKIYQVACD